MKKILIVDDDKEMTFATRRALASVKGIVMETLNDSSLVIEKFREYKPDLVLLDMRMPGLNGHEICTLIRNDPAGKDVKIIMISGAMDARAEEKLIQAGANDFLPKPFRSDYLQIKVERILDLI
jgi:CheY-like chemotaxis protein